MSHTHFSAAQNIIPGGVNSPVRAFKSVGGAPIFFDRGEGCHVFDTEGKSYIDYVGSWGPMILGHAHPEVIAAVQQTAEKGLSFGAPTTLETELAEKVCQTVPSVDKVRMVNSGTEATMTALRMARGFTGRNKILKFNGCYHGHSDSLLVKAGSGVLTLGIPGSPGIPESITQHTLTAEYNNFEDLNACFEKFGDDIAAVILEPIAGNMNCILPTETFLKQLRTLCTKHGSILIFDEVMTGFRVAKAGAEELLNITPDLSTFGKVIGGGMPVGAIGGREEIMNILAPVGPVYQAGTLSGNPIAMVAGLTQLNVIHQTEGFYKQLMEKTRYLVEGILAAALQANIPVAANYTCGMFGLFFTEQTVVNCFDHVAACDAERFKKFFHLMLDNGIYLAPSAFEAGFVSITHTQEALDKTIEAAARAFEVL